MELDFFSKEDWANAIYRTVDASKLETGVDHSLSTGMTVPGSRRNSGVRSLNTLDSLSFSPSAISLTIGTLGGYALSRTSLQLRVLAAHHRADLPRHAADHTGLGLSCSPSSNSAPLGVICGTSIIVLVAINQPFTFWMLTFRSLRNIPKELDESAKVDGCTPVSGLPPCDHSGHVAGRDHHRAVLASFWPITTSR